MLRRTPEKSCLRRRASCESVFNNSKSLAEEVADALLKRAGALRSSHPSVIIGRDKRIIEGLLDVAEAVREYDSHRTADGPDCWVTKSDRMSVSFAEFTEPENHVQKQIAPEPLIGSCSPELSATADTIEVKQDYNSQNSRDMSVASGDSSNISQGRWNHTYQEETLSEPFTTTFIHEESTFMRFRLAFDDSTVRDDDRPSTDAASSSGISKSTIPKRRIPRNFLSKNQRDSLTIFVQSRLQKESKPEERSPWAARIRNLFKKERLRKARKRLHNACRSGLKTAENGFSRLKSNFKGKRQQ